MIDILIIGQGLAGSLLGVELIKQGYRILVVDNAHATSSTTIAVGIMNPVVGQRLTPLWESPEHQSFTINYYLNLELYLNTSFVSSHQLIRFLQSEQECDYLDKRQKEPGFSEAFSTATDISYIKECCDCTQAYFHMNPVYRIDTQTLLRSTREFFIKHNSYTQETFVHEELDLSQPEIIWGDRKARHIVFCEGAVADKNPFFSHLEFKNAFGHILDIESPHLPANTILNHGKWMCPMQERGTFKYGASSFWEDSPENQRQALDDLKAGLDRFLTCDYSIKTHALGCRPYLKDRQPIFKCHPDHSNMSILNGFGGQGLAKAPMVITSQVPFELQPSRSSS